MSYEIEKNIPPGKGSHRPPERKYPIYDLKENESFFVADCEEQRRAVTPLHARLSSLVSTARYSIHPDAKFMVRKIYNDAGNYIGVRVWRLKNDI